MKRITLFLSLFLAFTAFAKAASTDNAAISQFQNKLTTTKRPDSTDNIGVLPAICHVNDNNITEL